MTRQPNTGMKKTEKQWRAMAEAFRECAQHMSDDWTDDAEEQTQGHNVAEYLNGKAEDCEQAADKVSSANS